MPITYQSQRGHLSSVPGRYQDWEAALLLRARTEGRGTLNEIPPGFKIGESVNGVASLMQDRPSPSAALDVFDHEPLEADSPLRGLDNAYLFPLAAGATKETQDATGRMAVENAILVLQGKKPLYVVNPEVLG